MTRPKTAISGLVMQLYAILSRSGWRSGAELEQAAERSTQVGNEYMPDDVCWIRSYVLEESGGSVGTVCVYQATSPEAIRKHAQLADLPVDETIRIGDTAVVRPDPQPVAARQHAERDRQQGVRLVLAPVDGDTPRLFPARFAPGRSRAAESRGPPRAPNCRVAPQAPNGTGSNSERGERR